MFKVIQNPAIVLSLLRLFLPPTLDPVHSDRVEVRAMLAVLIDDQEKHREILLLQVAQARETACRAANLTAVPCLRPRRLRSLKLS